MIKRLVIKDCLGIEELVINPGKVNVISGGNEKGKTSILETIEKALFNTKRRAKFVRTGAEKAFIELDTDDGIYIKRTVAEDEAGLDKGSVKVLKDGQPQKSPETFLKELFGAVGKKNQDIFAFNPVDFMQKKDTEQTDILLGLMPIKVSLEDALEWFGQAPKVNYDKHGLQVLKALEQWFYDARREAHAKVKATEDECTAVAKRLPDNYNLAEWEGVSLTALFDDTREAEKNNNNIKDCREALDKYGDNLQAINNQYALKEREIRDHADSELKKVADDIEAKKEEIKYQIQCIDAEIQELKNKKEQLQHQIKNLDEISLAEKKSSIDKITIERLKALTADKKKDIDKLDYEKKNAEFVVETCQEIDIGPLVAKYKHAEEMKSYIPLAKEITSLQTRLKEEEQILKRLDNCVNIARKKPHELLAKVELPVKGLGINGKGFVTINNLPLSNLSTAQQVKACLDIARALAKNTALKLICIDKVEHLDETIRAEFLKQIEADKDYQYFVTIVTDGELKVETR